MARHDGSDQGELDRCQVKLGHLEYKVSRCKEQEEDEDDPSGDIGGWNLPWAC